MDNKELIEMLTNPKDGDIKVLQEKVKEINYAYDKLLKMGRVKTTKKQIGWQPKYKTIYG